MFFSIPLPVQSNIQRLGGTHAAFTVLCINKPQDPLKCCTIKLNVSK